ncbi:hypothetical protein [Moritella sp. 5]
MIDEKCKVVPSYNDYWDVVGKTFEDIDGYHAIDTYLGV